MLYFFILDNIARLFEFLFGDILLIDLIYSKGFTKLSKVAYTASIFSLFIRFNSYSML